MKFITRVVSFFWTIFIICPVYILYCVINSIFFFVNCFNYKNFEKVEYNTEEIHKDYKENWMFDFISKFFTVVAASVSEFWKMLKNLKEIQL